MLSLSGGCELQPIAGDDYGSVRYRFRQ